MKYGLIGERLGHSFSVEIHSMLGDYEYELRELKKEELGEFLEKESFSGINVTIPYKEAIIPHLYYVDPTAEEIGSVNTVLRTEGHLFGFNTDFYGMIGMIERAGIPLFGRTVAILGTGGTSRTAMAVAKKIGAKEILKVSRDGKKDAITYTDLYEKYQDAEVIINTTPVGMHPECDAIPVDLSKFTKLEGVVDVIYNPLKTQLVIEAEKRGIKATGGLYMLVCQAVRAREIFTGKKIPEEDVEEVYGKILAQKENIVLIGMPSSGKSTVGAVLSKITGLPLIETDEVIVKKHGGDIVSIFEKRGESYFRDLEEEAVLDSSKLSGQIISTGGGVITRQINTDRLKRNGRLVFLDRPLELLTPTQDRPLAQEKQAISELYEKRYPIYSSVCDEKIDASATPDEIALEIRKRLKK